MLLGGATSIIFPHIVSALETFPQHKFSFLDKISNMWQLKTDSLKTLTTAVCIVLLLRSVKVLMDQSLFEFSTISKFKKE